MNIKTMDRMKRIMHRENILLRKKENRTINLLAAATLLLILAIALLFPGRFEGETVAIQTRYQAFGTVLFQDAGGYVLVIVLAFSAGVLFTITCQQIRKKRKSQETKSS